MHVCRLLSLPLSPYWYTVETSNWGATWHRSHWFAELVSPGLPSLVTSDK